MNLNCFYLIWKNYYISDISKHKPSLSAITGDFNARPSYWWCKDINITEGVNLYSLMSSNGFSQSINTNTYSSK